MLLFMQVLSDLDDPSCLALGLCYAISVPQHQATPVHLSLISMLRYTTISFTIRMMIDCCSTACQILNSLS